MGGGGRGGRGRGHGVAVNEARQRRGMIRNGLAAIIVQSQGFATAISSFSNPVRMNHAYNLLNLHS
ncbi:hypothetical protein L549_3021 [Bordetella pertussis H939]|nr:hypothetical protein L549_3021 [Bordetella pertussis H939]